MGDSYIETGDGPRVPRYRKLVKASQPAAGADWSLTVPGGRIWRVRSLVATLATAVAVANRVVQFTLSDQTDVYLSVQTLPPVVASTTVRYSLWEGQADLATLTAGLDIGAPLWCFWMPAGTVIASSTTALQAADQWSLVKLFVDEMYDGPGDVPYPLNAVETF